MARKPENYAPLVEEINKSGGKAVGISTDVADAKSVSAAFEKIKTELPGLGLAAAVFNVGGRFVRKPFLELSEDDFLAGYEANGYVASHPLGALFSLWSADANRATGKELTSSPMPPFLSSCPPSPIPHTHLP